MADTANPDTANPDTPASALPQQGGSYVRQPDGTLVRHEHTRDPGADAPEAPAPGTTDAHNP